MAHTSTLCCRTHSNHSRIRLTHRRSLHFFREPFLPARLNLPPETASEILTPPATSAAPQAPPPSVSARQRSTRGRSPAASTRALHSGPMDFSRSDKGKSHKKKTQRSRSAGAPVPQLLESEASPADRNTSASRPASRRRIAEQSPGLVYQSDITALSRCDRIPLPRMFTRLEQAVLKVLWLAVAPDPIMTSHHPKFPVSMMQSRLFNH